jgi:hypothetical protein
MLKFLIAAALIFGSVSFVEAHGSHQGFRRPSQNQRHRQDFRRPHRQDFRRPHRQNFVFVPGVGFILVR